MGKYFADDCDPDTGEYQRQDYSKGHKQVSLERMMFRSQKARTVGPASTTSRMMGNYSKSNTDDGETKPGFMLGVIY